ncbi:MAG: hypothetical protein ABIQ01_05350 [Pseudolysinimonas sp.]
MSRLFGSAAVAIAIVLGLTACNSGYHPSERVANANVIGTWTAPANGKSSPAMEFLADKTFQGTGLPSGLFCGDFFTEPDSASPVTVEGDWSIGEDRSNNLYFVELTTDDGCVDRLYSEELANEFHLFIWIGDPDEDNTVTFSKAD